MYLEGLSALFFQEVFFSENTTLHCKHTCKNSFSGNTQLQYLKTDKPSTGFSCYHHSQASTYANGLVPNVCKILLVALVISLHISILLTSQLYKNT